MSYKRRRGLGRGRGGKPRGGETSDGALQASREQAEPGVPEDAETGDSAEAVRSPRVLTLAELFRVQESAGSGGRGGNHRGRRWLISLGVVALFFAGGYVAAAQWVLPGGRSTTDPSLVRVPELVGLTEDEAQGRLDRLGLEYNVRSGMTHHLAPEGAVLSQDPLPGQFARPGAPVYVSLSRGPELHILPDVAGLSERQATIILERLGYSVAVDRRTHILEEGRAIATVPEAGTELAVPAEVSLVVSEGRPVVQVPELVGMHVDDAASALTAAGLELGAITYDPQALDAPGRIVGQYPPEGYSLRQGSRIEVRVAGDVDRVDPTRAWFEPDRPNGR